MLAISFNKKRFYSLMVQVAAASVVSVLTWSNWQEPNLHDYPEPISVAVVQLSGPALNVEGLHRLVTHVSGITACTISADVRSMAFTYHPNEVTPEQVQQQLPAAWHAQLYQAPPALITGPQCPVPQGYVVALERLRFALNLRRLFVKV